MKRSRFIFIACLVLSVMSTFTFAAAGFSTFDFRESKPITDGSVASVDTDYTIDCLAECTVKSRVCASLPSRKSTHIIRPFGTSYAGITPLFSVIKITQPTKVLNNKDTILLKLRI